MGSWRKPNNYFLLILVVQFSPNLVSSNFESNLKNVLWATSCNVHNSEMLAWFGWLIFTFCCSNFDYFHGECTCSIWYMHENFLKKSQTSNYALFRTPNLFRIEQLEPKLHRFEISNFSLFFQEWVSVELVRTKTGELESFMMKIMDFFEIWIWWFSASSWPFLKILGVLKSAEREVFSFLKISSCAYHMRHVHSPWK